MTGSSDKISETFTGKELDGEERRLSQETSFAGLLYFGARYYDPEVGMWMSPDPARQFASPYAYSPNPVNSVDPDGKQSIEAAINYSFSSSFQNKSLQQFQDLPKNTLNVAGKVNAGVNLAANVGAFIPPIAGPSLAIAGATDALAVGIEFGKYSLDPSASNGKSLVINLALTGLGAGVAAQSSKKVGEGLVSQVDGQRAQASSGLASHWAEFLTGVHDLFSSSKSGE